jgi:hypothetical protein
MFEPHFYFEVLSKSRREIVYHFIKLLIVFSILISAARIFYLFDKEKGLPQTLSRAFPGMAIREGTLYPPSGKPYVPPAYLIVPVLNQLFALPAMLNDEADSLVIVDTSGRSVVSRKLPVVLLKAREMVVHLNPTTTMKFSYENIMFGKKDLIFTPDQIALFLRKHLVGIFFGYFFSAVIHQGVLFFFSIFFLGIAAYIFRLERRWTFREYLKTSTFAISPVAVGSALIAFSGVKVGWSWHVLILLSTIVLFRAILVTGRGSTGDKE